MLLLAACASTGAPPFRDADVEVTLAEAVSTVAFVTWGDDDADEVRVEFGPTTDYGHEAEGRDGRARLFGMPADATWHFRVVATRDGQDYAGADHTLHTGGLPSGVPSIEVLTPGDPGGYVLTSTLVTHSAGTAVMVLDGEGQVVWYQLPEWGVAMASKVSADGESVITLLSSHEEIEDARLLRVSVEGELLEEIPVPIAHHDFVERPGEGYAILAGERREIDGVAVIGDRILEIDSDGATREVWNAFDHFPVEENWGFTFMAYPIGADWTHANSLVYDPVEDTYTLSLYMQRCIVRVARASGEQLWSMCGDGSGDIVADAAFGPQHSLELADDGLVFYDNAYDEHESRIVHYAIGDTTATRTSEWLHPEHLKSVVLGDVQTLPDGRMLSSWGEWREALVSDGDVVDWRIRVPDAGSIAQVESFAGF